MELFPRNKRLVLPTVVSPQKFRNCIGFEEIQQRKREAEQGSSDVLTTRLLAVCEKKDKYKSTAKRLEAEQAELQRLLDSQRQEFQAERAAQQKEFEDQVMGMGKYSPPPGPPGLAGPARPGPDQKGPVVKSTSPYFRWRRCWLRRKLSSGRRKRRTRRTGRPLANHIRTVT